MVRWHVGLAMLMTTAPVAVANAQGFLSAPLECADAACSTRYSLGVYSPGIITSVLDHSMSKNSNGSWPYSAADGVVIAFNGEIASGKPKSSDKVCITGTILLKPSSSASNKEAMVNTRGCGSGYASYDEHPGYDFRAARSTPVTTAAPGYVVDLQKDRCITANNMGRTCAYWGAVAIDHGNGYFTQYLHLDNIYVTRGQRVRAGAVIGLSGDRGVESSPHLHFEVFKLVGGTYYIVDPYGWVGSGKDPLTRTGAPASIKLWK